MSQYNLPTIAQKLDNIIRGYGVNADDADWLRSLAAAPATQPVPSISKGSDRIAACDPDTIRALLAERDALRQALTEVLRVNETDAGNDVKAWANAMLNAHAALAAAQEAPTQAVQAVPQEPFGYFRAGPFGWTDCAETDEGAKALYEHPPTPQSAAAINGYTCTVPDDCETLHWRGQILSMNELASMAQPAVGEEIMVNAAHGVFTLPLQPSGLSSGPRFVVHVPAPEQKGASNG